MLGVDGANAISSFSNAEPGGAESGGYNARDETVATMTFSILAGVSLLLCVSALLVRVLSGSRPGGVQLQSS